MPPLKCLLVALTLCALTLAVASCGGGKSTPSATNTPRALPSPVTLEQEPVGGFQLGDPTLTPLAGATVDAGRLGGTVYQIEMPDHWNGRLVLFMHGNDQDSTLHVYPPINRDYLIEHGYAWASSSYSVNIAYVSGRAADDTAALWDEFVQKHGRPQYTYVMGESMGGSAVITSTERYADRYDGGLSLCGDSFPPEYSVDFFPIAAYAAGITQQQFDTTNFGVLVAQVRTALRDPVKRKLFEDIWIDQTGGSRPFGREGLEQGDTFAWQVYPSNVVSRSGGNDGKVYKLGPTAGVSSDDFNSGVIRFKQESTSPHDAGNEVTGDIKMPLLAVQSTGDVSTAFSEIQQLQAKVSAAGKSDLLVERAIQSPLHCFNHGTTMVELDTAFEDLVQWVEQGKKPKGEDLTGDVTDAGKAFTLAPRVGSPEANKVKGADQRLTLHGTITLDGQPVDNAFLWVIVEKDGLRQPCSYYLPPLDAGQYSVPVAADAELTGCGAPGAKVYLALFKDGTRYLSDKTIDWLSAKDATFDAAFSSARPTGAATEPTVDEFFGTGFFGTAFGKDHKPVAIGTVIEAVIGDTVCARYVVPPVVMVFSDQGSYSLNTASVESIPACAKDAPVSFRINGKPAPETSVNDYDAHGHEIALHAP